LSDQKGWSRRFDEPILLPNGRKLVTLHDAGEYIAALPRKTHNAPHWEAAAKALMLVVESGGPAMMAHIGMMQALRHGKESPRGPRRKRAKKYRVVK
jgi:hypothetical protein